MQYCSNCGTRLNEEAKFCPTCGTGVANFINATGTEPKSGVAEPVTLGEELIMDSRESSAVSEPAEPEVPGQTTEPEETGSIPAETAPQDVEAYEAPAASQSGTYQPASAPAEGSYYQSAAPQSGSSYYQSTPPQSSSSYYQNDAPQGGDSYDQQPPVQGSSSYYQQTPAQSGNSYYQQTPAQSGSSYNQQAPAQSGNSYYQQTPAQSGNSYYQQTPAQSGSSYNQQPPAQSANSYYQQAPAQEGNAYNQGGGAPNYQGAPYGGAPNYQQPKSGNGSVVAGVLFCIFLPLVGLIYTLIKKPFQKTGQIIAVIWCIVAMVLSILIPVIYYINYYKAYNELYNYENYWDDVEDELDDIIIDDNNDDQDDDVIVSGSPDNSNTYGDIPVQLSIFDSVTADNIVKAFDEIGLDIEDVTSLVYDTDWENGPVYTFEYKDATVDLYLYDEGTVYSIETAGTQVYLEGYEPWQIDDYIGGSSDTSSAPVSSAPAGVMPDNGYVFYEIGYDRVCPLTIITQGEYGYYIKLVDAYNETEILAFFVQPGQTVDINVPLGDYYIKYASGLTWYDEASLFGTDTAYSQAGDIFYFTEDEENYYGYTVELYMQDGGNLDTYDITPGDF